MKTSQISKWLNLIQKGVRAKDSITTGFSSGLAGTVVMDISNFILWRLGLTEGTYAHLSGSIMMNPWRTKQRKNYILGQIYHMAIGGLMGIPMFHILKKTGKDHYLAKGVILGSALWGIVFDIGIRMKIFRLKPHLTKSYYAAIWHNILYGITTAKVIVSLSDPSIFEKSKPPRESF